MKKLQLLPGDRADRSTHMLTNNDANQMYEFYQEQNAEFVTHFLL